MVVAYDRPDNGDLFLFYGQTHAGDYSINLSERRKIGWGWHTDNVITMTALPAVTRHNYLELWFLRRNGTLSHITANMTTDVGTVTAVSTKFTGYRSIS
ncbi:hypothetical protein ACWGNE_02000 [Streptomyces xiamenensis]